MSAPAEVTDRPRILDTAELRKVMERVNRRTGFVPDPSATAAKARALQREAGIRAEENAASRDLYRIRYGEDWQEDWPESGA